MPRKVYRGEMYFADLNHVKGSEQGGNRPVTKAKLPTHHIVRPYAGLTEESIVLLEQIRTIDKKRLGEYIGQLDENDMEQIDRCLAISLDLKVA